LETYFKEGEGVGISDTKLNANGEADPGPGDVFLREFWLKRLGRKPIDQIYPKARDGLFIRINPIAKNGKADKDITSFRHCLVEFDLDQAGNRIQKEVQYAALIENDLPISVVLDSGNKSIHGWVRIDAPDRAEYDRRRDIVWEYFEKAGLLLDSGNKNPSRYSRCPGVERNLYDKDGNLIGTGRQELLAVNVGAASWEKWEKAQQATQDECREYDREETARLLGEDRPFPAPMDETAYYGIAGEIVSIIAAGNEPCRESLLGHFLIAAGNMIGWNLGWTRAVTNTSTSLVYLSGLPASAVKARLGL